MPVEFSLAWLGEFQTGYLCFLLACMLLLHSCIWSQPRHGAPSFAWFIYYVVVRFLIVETLVLSPFVFLVTFPEPAALLGGLGALTVVYLLCIPSRRSSYKLISEPGCLILLMLVPSAMLLGVGFLVAHLVGLSAEWMLDLAAILLSLFWLLGPVVYHLNLVEQLYYRPGSKWPDFR